MQRNALAAIATVLVLVLAFYGFFSNPFIVRGYYTMAPGEGVSSRETESYVHLGSDEITLISKSDLSDREAVAEIEYVDSDRPDYTCRIRIDGDDLYVRKSFFRLTVCRPDRDDHEATLQKVVNPITLVRLVASGWSSDDSTSGSDN